MKRLDLQKTLQHLDELNIYVFTRHDLRKWFVTEPVETFNTALQRHVRSGLLIKATRSVYVNPAARCRDSYTLEHIAVALRRGYYSYVSLESLLSETGVISQMPINVLTLMTTGRSQYFKTTYGHIEFIHTQKPIANIIKTTFWQPPRPIRITDAQTALKDLRHVKRNLHLIDEDELKNA